ncbi:1-acyl-sn-glycerol-3-phosphate acyltransferase [Nodosilinea sp. LEGE 06152]|uniref:1-acyl-sn-glycerol-3-phosphate acyltransferase n=1 Tax=Nodosilinea sp. LEGE 06152 TaxID=2777966 RepID=UPI00187FD7CF|nr:1-acyl-sn-glycerol-3-phosphate acyltransferase [Nodosilinea sp. LEGE 06152]MBE9158679.1 1-acyl-sn-glycerol-3-phosphate acyltransferase [Nodosilinea sp. LEGE 06152]
MPKLNRAQPPLGFIPPRYKPWVVQGCYIVLPLMLRLRLRPWLPAGIWPVTCHNPEVLAECFRQFQTGKIRLLLAFRHSQVDDPICLSYLFSRLVPRAARQKGFRLKRPLHSFFMYDRGMPLWAGRWLGWFFAAIGGIPVHRGRRLDLKALKAVREQIMTAPLPVTIAPEGATNGHGEVISDLEPGTAQLAFWAVEDLQKAERPEQVLLLPVGLRYIYPRPDWAALNRLLSQLEADCGLPVQSFSDPAGTAAEAYYPRLLGLGQHLLTRLEGFYQRFYGLTPTEFEAVNSDPSNPGSSNLGPSNPDPVGELGQRLSHLLNGALAVGERFFALPSTGTLVTRCRRLEEAGWSYIYREDINDLGQLSPFDRGLADWIAAAATLQMQHMRLAESFVAVSGHYVKDKPSFERFAETTLILFDLVERVKGTRVPKRPQLGTRQAVISLGEPMNISDRWPDYAQSRRSAKAAVEGLTKDIQAALEELIAVAEGTLTP